MHLSQRLLACLMIKQDVRQLPNLRTGCGFASGGVCSLLYTQQRDSVQGRAAEHNVDMRVRCCPQTSDHIAKLQT